MPPNPAPNPRPARPAQRRLRRRRRPRGSRRRSVRAAPRSQDHHQLPRLGSLRAASGRDRRRPHPVPRRPGPQGIRRRSADHPRQRQDHQRAAPPHQEQPAQRGRLQLVLRGPDRITRSPRPLRPPPSRRRPSLRSPAQPLRPPPRLPPPLPHHRQAPRRADSLRLNHQPEISRRGLTVRRIGCLDGDKRRPEDRATRTPPRRPGLKGWRCVFIRVFGSSQEVSRATSTSRPPQPRSAPEPRPPHPGAAAGPGAQRVPGIGLDPIPGRTLQLRGGCNLTPHPLRGQRPVQSEPGRTRLIRHRRRTGQAPDPADDLLAGGCQPRPEHLTRHPVDRRRDDRPRVHVQPNTRTLREHRGLPHLSDRPSAGTRTR